MMGPLLPLAAVFMVFLSGTEGQALPGISKLAHRYERYFLNEGCKTKGDYPKIDLVFVLDGGESIEIDTFRMCLQFLKDSLPYFSISPSNTRVAMVTFSIDVKVEFDFDDYTNRDCVAKAIGNVKFVGRSSATGDALAVTSKLCGDASAGAREDAKKIVLLLTDGYTDHGSDLIKAATTLKDESKAELFVFGVGFISPHFNVTLNHIASTPKYMHLNMLPTPSYLNGIIQRCTHVAQQDVCCTKQDNDIVYDECGQRCTCSGGKMINCCRVREEITSMSCADRGRYLKAYKIMTTQEPHKSRYELITTIHKTIFFSSGIHTKSQFLPWHRWFILEIENALKAIDCRVTVPYWAWSLRAQDPWNTAVLWSSGSDGLGGNGAAPDRCVSSGQFSQSQGSWTTPEGACLMRNFNGNPPDEVQIAASLALTDFDDFELNLRANLHDSVHCRIDGTMCSIEAAFAPEFFLHHGYVDKLWNDWQQKSTANKNVFFPSINGTMASTPYERKQFIDIEKQPGCVRVCYEEATVSNAVEVKARLKAMSLTDLTAIPRKSTSKVSSKARILFKLTTEEESRSKELETMTTGSATAAGENEVPQLVLNGVEQVLGFKVAAPNATNATK